MNDQTVNPDIDETLVNALAERVAGIVADSVYQRLRADVCMGDDMLVTEAEMAAILDRHPNAVAAWRKISVGPQGVRIAGSRKLLYRIGAVRHYLTEVRAGAMHLTPFLEAQARVEPKRESPTATG